MFETSEASGDEAEAPTDLNGRDDGMPGGKGRAGLVRRAMEDPREPSAVLPPWGGGGRSEERGLREA